MTYDRITRRLHAGIVLGVAVQLTTSALMDDPVTVQSGFGFLQIHEGSGLTVLALLASRWAWGFSRSASGRWGKLFPWFSKESRGRLLSDLRSLPQLLREGFSEGDTRGEAVAGAIHGLGLLAATGTALSGSILFLCIMADGALSAYAGSVLDVHGFMAGVLMAYLAGHVAMAVLHQLRGDKVLSRMFNLF